MAVRVKLNDNSRAVFRQLDGNVSAALYAMGVKAQNMILYQMRQGFGKPIRQTGDLQRDVQFEVDNAEQCVRVGNTLNYAPYVHEGTRKMAARPYIQNALTGESHVQQLQKVAETYLKKGF